MDSRKDKIDSPRLTCRDPEGRARLMPDVDLMAEAMVRANLPEWCGGKIETMEQLRKVVAV